MFCPTACGRKPSIFHDFCRDSCARQAQLQPGMHWQDTARRVSVACCATWPSPLSRPAWCARMALSMSSAIGQLSSIDGQGMMCCAHCGSRRGNVPCSKKRPQTVGLQCTLRGVKEVRGHVVVSAALDQELKPLFHVGFSGPVEPKPVG